MRVAIKVDIGKLRSVIDGNTRLFANESLYRHAVPYIPRETGTLMELVEITEKGIRFTQPYAHYQWYGLSKSGNPLHYSKSQHPLATDHWEEQVKLNHYDTIIREIKNYIREKNA